MWLRLCTSLAGLQVVIPEQCLLNPSPVAAVVGGNVLTSQRVTDVVLKAFWAAAASQVGEWQRAECNKHARLLTLQPGLLLSVWAQW
jgi:N-methylhydantoinase B/oxoprolinase/acetone carboxylase alpha subunit